MERGANTFPFHNLLPYSESNEGLFLFFSPSLNWIKEKSVATLAIRTFAIQKISKSVHRITQLLCKLHLHTYTISFTHLNNIYNTYTLPQAKTLKPCGKQQIDITKQTQI